MNPYNVRYRAHGAELDGALGGPAPFSPDTLALSAWWQAPGAVPWVGSSSAGASGSRSMTTVGANPSFATSLNGKAYADFSGSQWLVDSVDTFGGLVSTTEFTMVLLLNATSAVARAANPYDNSPLLTSSGGDFGVGISTSGVEPWFYDGTYTGPVAACGTGAWHMAFITYGVSVLSVAIDSGAAVTLAKSSVILPSGDIRMGLNWSASLYFTGGIAEFMAAPTALTAGDRTNIRAYFNSRYALSL